MSFLISGLYSFSLKAQTLSGDMFYYSIKDRFSQEFCKDSDPLSSCATISREYCEYQVAHFLDQCWGDARLPWIEEQRKSTVLKQLGPCVSRRFVSTNKGSWLQSKTCEDWLRTRGQGRPFWEDSADIRSIRSKTPAGKKNSLKQLYPIKVAEKTGNLHRINKLLSKEFRVLCPSHSGRDLYTCVKTVYSSTNIEFTTDLVLLSSAAVYAMLKDRNMGYASSILKLMGAENLIFLLEKMDLSKLYIAQYQAHDIAEKVELNNFKAMEEKLLRQAYGEISKSIGKLLKEAEASKDAESIQNIKEAKLKYLKARYEKIKSASLAIP
ncbi:hypothetical protein ACLWBD_05300 [Bdellovibrio sp. HCB117]|uniref:hypothetical protein n=1 Tax=Bdellovibrio sp. HCB117 TaxID=3394359 RepID=UPI0039B653E4